ncbi:type II toxin-antitoxin system PrlF family antitoxin [Atlantibacter sp.]|uniref:type II toxin-antitoxin system PrlF family antitoxin n=1 Tax=Atlantibacter sp. TaxID=1903473 RepID=UPI0028AA402C|nr:type II toxin-antitoxin system PrlF family antitoxin [Atlantibacter sp.]
MAGVTLRASSKLTARSQTTIPASVRDAMNLKPGEEIEYAVLADGQVLMTRKEANAEDDPVMESFLSFLANDIQRNPSQIHALDTAFWADVDALTEGVDVDLDAPLNDEKR